MTEKRTIILEVELDADDAVQGSKELDDSLEKTGKQADQTSGSFGALGGALGSLDQALGGLPSKARAGISGLKGLSGGFKGLRVAIISTGIGALLIALTSLVVFFTKTQRGIDLVSKAMAFLGAAIEPLIDLAITIGETLVNAFTDPLAAVQELGAFITKVFTDPRQAIEDLGKATTEFFNDVIERGTEAIALEQRRQDLRRVEIAQITELAQLEVDRSTALLNVEDRLNFSARERLEFLNQAEQATRRVFELQKLQAEESLAILVAQNALGESTDEDLRNEQELRKAIILLQKEQDDGLKRIFTKRTELSSQVEKEIALENARIEQLMLREEIEVEGLDRRIERKGLENAAILELDTQLAIDEVDLAQATADRIQKVNEDAAKNDQKIRDLQLDAELENADIILGASSQLAQSLFGDNKAGAIASAIINVIQGITKAIAQGGIAGIATGAVVAAAGFAQVQKIQQTEFATGGMIRGMSHSRGGRNINVEGGEAVLNKRSMSSPVLRSLASAINTAGGGVPLTSPSMKTRFQTGGLVEDTLVNFESTLNNAIQGAPPVLVTEDFNEVNTRVEVTEDRAEL